MPRLIVTRGLPASGKTTLAKAWVNERPDVRACCNRDILRIMLQGGRLGTREQEDAVSLVQHHAIRELLRAGWSVVCDDTNLAEKSARGLATIAAEVGAELEVWDLTRTVPLNECIRRDKERPEAVRVGEDVIRSMHRRYLSPLRGRGFPPLRPFPPVQSADLSSIPVCVQPAPGEAPDAVLVDLDGTVALMGDRDPYDYSSVGGDAVNEIVRTVVLALAGDHDVLFMSGRDEVCRPDTEKWLHATFPGLVDSDAWSTRLFMRPAGDDRPDWQVKHELFLKHVAGQYRVALVLDDREQVVRMWRAMGLPVFQVAEGNF